MVLKILAKYQNNSFTLSLNPWTDNNQPKKRWKNRKIIESNRKATNKFPWCIYMFVSRYYSIHKLFKDPEVAAGYTHNHSLLVHMNLTKPNWIKAKIIDEAVIKPAEHFFFLLNSKRIKSPFTKIINTRERVFSCFPLRNFHHSPQFQNIYITMPISIQGKNFYLK